MSDPIIYQRTALEETCIGYLPGAEAAQIWLALNRKMQSDPQYADCLTVDERILYDRLTAKFIFDASMVGVSYSTTNPEDQ